LVAAEKTDWEKLIPDLEHLDESLEKQFAFADRVFIERTFYDGSEGLYTRELRGISFRLHSNFITVEGLQRLSPYFHCYFAALRTEFVMAKINKELAEAIKLLEDDSSTRRAVVHDPDFIWEGQPACLMAAHLMVRRDQSNQVYLDIFLHFRSCDYYKTFLYDLYVAKKILEGVANYVGAEPRIIYVYADSFHIYENEVEEVKSWKKKN